MVGRRHERTTKGFIWSKVNEEWPACEHSYRPSCELFLGQLCVTVTGKLPGSNLTLLVNTSLKLEGRHRWQEQPHGSVLSCFSIRSERFCAYTRAQASRNPVVQKPISNVDGTTNCPRFSLAGPYRVARLGIFPATRRLRILRLPPPPSAYSDSPQVRVETQPLGGRGGREMV